MNKRKEICFSIIGVLILFVFVVGISYAVWNKTFLGSKENSINTGYVSFSYNESQTNVIEIKNAVPISDDNGKLLSGDKNIFDFNVSARFAGLSSIDYEIYATPTVQIMDSKYIKVYLTDQNDQPVEGYKDEVPVFSSLSNSSTEGSKTLYKSSINSSGQSVDYRLRIWVSDEFNEPQESKKFAFKVNVVGVA